LGAGAAGVRLGPPIVDRGPDTDRRVLDPEERRAPAPRASGARGPGAAAPERRHLLPPPGSQSGTPRPRRGPSRQAVDVTRLAWRRARRRGDRRNVAPRPRGAGDRVLAPTRSSGARGGRGGSAVLAAPGSGQADHRPLGRVTQTGEA